jgi:hypothetical protein
MPSMRWDLERAERILATTRQREPANWQMIETIRSKGLTRKLKIRFSRSPTKTP